MCIINTCKSQNLEIDGKLNSGIFFYIFSIILPLAIPKRFKNEVEGYRNRIGVIAEDFYMFLSNTY